MLRFKAYPTARFLNAYQKPKSLDVYIFMLDCVFLAVTMSADRTNRFETANMLSVYSDVSKYCAVVLKAVVNVVALLTPALENSTGISSAFANKLSRNRL